jgi:hypothetical protein
MPLVSDFYLGTLVFSTDKTDHLLKVALNTPNPYLKSIYTVVKLDCTDM